MQDVKDQVANRVGGSFAVDLAALPLPPEGRARVGAQLAKAVLDEIARVDNLGDLVIIGRFRGELYGYIRPDLDAIRKIGPIIDEALKR